MHVALTHVGVMYLICINQGCMRGVVNQIHHTPTLLQQTCIHIDQALTGVAKQ